MPAIASGQSDCTAQVSPFCNPPLHFFTTQSVSLEQGIDDVLHVPVIGSTGDGVDITVGLLVGSIGLFVGPRVGSDVIGLLEGPDVPLPHMPFGANCPQLTQQLVLKALPVAEHWSLHSLKHSFYVDIILHTR